MMETAEAFARVGRALLSPPDDQELQKEYVRLFLNPAGVPCPPWQSAQSEEHRLMGAAHLRALEWYRGEGVEPQSSNEPADHAGLLLLFYSHLLETGAPPGKLASFRTDHLVWIGEFCDCIRRQARQPFYRQLAETIQDLLAPAPTE